MIHPLLERSTDLWKQIGESGGPSAFLLKLAVLRDIHRAIHARKSGCLAKGQRDEARRLGEWETRVQELRLSASLDGDLTELIERPASSARKRTRVLPDALFSFIPKEKLERYDRIWENALAAQACSLGWRFWILDAWVQIPLIERWNQTLTEQLWPHGIVLFTENAGFLESRTDNPDDALWRGQWYVILDPRFTDPNELSRGIAEWPGGTITAPTPAHWRAVFTPKRY
ncbi:MAG: hypothetical protein NDJ89_05715 [Oligoflexia bacterium]|nr:hypothetical protein [Oligoflexia bacterium]